MNEPSIVYKTIAWVYPPDHSAVSCHVELLFYAEDPYSVTLKFGANVEDPVVWVFGRDLLNAAANTPQEVGSGDITFAQVMEGRLMGCLESPHGKSKFSLSLDSVRGFLGSTQAVVPFGKESAAYEGQIDDDLECLLGTRNKPEES